MREADRQVTERLGELALRGVRIHSSRNISSRLAYSGTYSRYQYQCLHYMPNFALTLNNDVSVLNVDLDAIGDGELFLGVAVAHLSA